MKFKTDENLPMEVVTTLGDHGHDAIRVVEQNLGTVSAIVGLTEQVVRLLENSSPVGQLWILDESHVRIRPK